MVHHITHNTILLVDSICLARSHKLVIASWNAELSLVLWFGTEKQEVVDNYLVYRKENCKQTLISASAHWPCSQRWYIVLDCNWVCLISTQSGSFEICFKKKKWEPCGSYLFASLCKIPSKVVPHFAHTHIIFLLFKNNMLWTDFLGQFCRSFRTVLSESF